MAMSQWRDRVNEGQKTWYPLSFNRLGTVAVSGRLPERVDAIAIDRGPGIVRVMTI